MRYVILAVAALLVAPAAFADVTPINLVCEVDNECNTIYLDAQVTVRGIAVSGIELGSSGPAVIEDETGGIALYDWPVGCVTGDDVECTGFVAFYNGLIEIVDDPVTSDPYVITIHSSGNAVTPHVITIPEMDDVVPQGDNFLEVWESTLIKLECVRFIGVAPDSAFPDPYQTYTLEDGVGNQGTLYYDTSTDLTGQLIPQGWLDVVGCLGQYVFGPPWCTGYQIIPRSMADFEYTPSAVEDATWSSVKALYR